MKKEKFVPAIVTGPNGRFRFPSKSPEQIAEDMMSRQDIREMAQEAFDKYQAYLAQKTCQ